MFRDEGSRSSHAWPSAGEFGRSERQQKGGKHDDHSDLQEHCAADVVALAAQRRQPKNGRQRAGDRQVWPDVDSNQNCLCDMIGHTGCLHSRSSHKAHWQIVGEVAADRDGERYFRTRPDLLVVRHAILGLVPDWRLAAVPEAKFETWENGRHRWFVRRHVRTVVGTLPDGSDHVVVYSTEADGWSARRQRPVTGAYRKPYLDPDPVPTMVERAEYEIFCAAMAMLFDALAGRLETIDLVAVDWPARPWMDSGEDDGLRRQPRILPDLSRLPSAKEVLKTPTKTRRKRAPKQAEKAA